MQSQKEADLVTQVDQLKSGWNSQDPSANTVWDLAGSPTSCPAALLVPLTAGIGLALLCAVPIGHLQHSLGTGANFLCDCWKRPGTEIEPWVPPGDWAPLPGLVGIPPPHCCHPDAPRRGAGVGEGPLFTQVPHGIPPQPTHPHPRRRQGCARPVLGVAGEGGFRLLSPGEAGQGQPFHPPVVFCPAVSGS